MSDSSPCAIPPSVSRVRETECRRVEVRCVCVCGLPSVQINQSASEEIRVSFSSGQNASRSRVLVFYPPIYLI